MNKKVIIVTGGAGQLGSAICKHFDENNIGRVVPSESVELFLLESSIWTGLYKRDFLEENLIRFHLGD